MHAQAIGAMTPAATALIALVLLGKVEKALTYFTLIPVMAGIVLATGFEPSFHSLGFFAAIGACGARAFKAVLQVGLSGIQHHASGMYAHHQVTLSVKYQQPDQPPAYASHLLTFTYADRQCVILPSPYNHAADFCDTVSGTTGYQARKRKLDDYAELKCGFVKCRASYWLTKVRSWTA